MALEEEAKKEEAKREEAKREEAKREEAKDQRERSEEMEVEAKPEVLPDAEGSQRDEGRQIKILPGDLKKLEEIHNAFRKRKLEESKMDSNDGPPKSSNPFCKKRVATPCQSRSAERKQSRTQETSKTGGSTAPARQLKDLAAHSRGGFAAKEAATAVLAQRGFLELLEQQFFRANLL